MNAVTDSVTTATNTQFQSSGITNYSYDLNGNMLTRSNTINTQNNIIAVYNVLNLPQSMVVGGATVTYIYDAAGNKLLKVSGSVTTDYINGIQYTGSTIDFIQNEVGRAIPNGSDYKYEYNLSDHLGNIRYSFDVINGTVRLLQKDDYYPFGLRITKQISGLENKYLYNGKEIQQESNQYDYGARFYDPVIGRWNVVDPLAEDFDNVSPYNYGMNNPISMIDPDGMSTKDWMKEHGIKDSDLINVYTAPGGNEEEGNPKKQQLQNGHTISNTSGQGLRRNSDGTFDSYSTPNNHKCSGFCNLDHKGGEQLIDGATNLTMLMIPIRIKIFNFGKTKSSFKALGFASKYGLQNIKS